MPDGRWKMENSIIRASAKILAPSKLFSPLPTFLFHGCTLVPRGGGIVNREFPFVSQTLIAAKTITCSSWPAIEWGRNAQSYLMRKPSWMVAEFEQGEGGSGRKGRGRGWRRDVWRRDGAFLGSLIRASPDQLCPLSLMVKRINTWAKIGNRRTSETGGTGRGRRAERRRAVDLRGTRKKEELRGDSKEGREGVEEGILQAQEANQPRACVCVCAARGGGEGEVDARAHVEAIGVPC